MSAARAAFAEHGHEVPLEEIARAAQVSRTTLYRHFPTREDLAATVYADCLDRIEARAAELAGRPDGALSLFEFVLDLQLATRSVVPVLSRADTALFTDLATRTIAAFRPLVEEAVRAGTVRRGVGLDEVLLAIHMADAPAGQEEGAIRADQHARCRVILRNGLFTDEAVAELGPPAGPAPRS